MNAPALEIRNLTYSMFVGLGRAPTADELAITAGLSRADVHAAWAELDQAHALVLNPATAEIRMANPFSAVPTAYRVRAAERWWYANCAWDALGICAALHVDGEIEASCPDCGETIGVTLCGRRVDDERLLFHCLVPAARWWDDIVFT
jgi:Alkylmercury lyase